MQTHNKDLSNNQLAEVILKKIDEKIELVREEADQNVNRLARIMMEKFDQVDERFDKMDQRVGAVEDNLEKKIDNLENKIDRRMSATEDKVHVVKNILEKNLKVKVAW